MNEASEGPWAVGRYDNGAPYIATPTGGRWPADDEAVARQAVECLNAGGRLRALVVKVAEQETLDNGPQPELVLRFRDEDDLDEFRAALAE